MVKDKVLEQIIKDIADEEGLPEDVVEAIFESQFAFIRETLGTIDFDNITDEEGYDELKTNFNIPSLGKLHTNYNILKYRRNQIKKFKERQKNEKID